jgi:plastocyanin
MKNLIKVPAKSLCLLLPVLFFISCNSSDKNTAENIYSVDTIVIKQMQFSPALLNVKIGDTVVWINKDIVDHNITEEKSKAFYSDTLAVGKSWKMVVKDSADYLCTLHPSMKGKLVLK